MLKKFKFKNPEIFKTLKYDYYSTDEDKIDTFDDNIDAVLYFVRQGGESLSDCIESFVDEIGLHYNEFQAIDETYQKELREYEYHIDCKVDEHIENMRLKK